MLRVEAQQPVDLPQAAYFLKVALGLGLAALGSPRLAISVFSPHNDGQIHREP
jgi:hypothetical protein